MRPLARLLATAAVLAAFAPHPASAQRVLTSAASGTRPMQFVSAGSLVSGTTYQFRTDPATVTGTEDTVLALMSSASITAGAVAGSDGDSCGLGSGSFPSCFEYTPPTTGSRNLRLWAWRSANGGVANIQVRSRIGGGAWTAWSNLASNISFGGNSMGVSFPTSGRAHVASRSRPGNNRSHLLWVTQTNEWQIIAATTRSPSVIGRVTFDVPDVVAAGVNGSRRVVVGAYPLPGNEGRLELLRNDWFVTGEDWDEDGLSSTLENDLRTCDRTTSPDPSPGFTCASRWDCAGFPSSEECRGALRDTDHDGLSDYLEVYEYDDPLMRVSLWGADPAHLDVFVELDSWDQVAGGGCDTYTDGTDPGAVRGINDSQTDSQAFFARVASVWANGPTSVNPDGTAGLRIHYDVGTAYPQAGAEDTRWGNFGAGGTCVGCTDPDEIREGSTCAAAFPQVRRSAFHYAIDSPSWGAGGEAGAAAFSARNAAQHVHELGHLLVGDHGGPFGSTGELSNDFGNNRSTYISRMNYRFEFVGNEFGALTAQWSMASFSRGVFGMQRDMLGLQEQCPLGAGANLDVLGVSTVVFPESVNITGPSWSQCWNVDWNRTGLPAQSGPQLHIRHGELNNRLLRRSEWTDGVAGHGSYTPRRGLTSMITTGNVLVYAWTQRNSSTGAYEVRWRGESNGDCNAMPFQRTPTLEFNHPEFYTGGSYPGCYRPGTQAQFGVPPVQADAVSVARATVTLPSGNSSPGAVFVHNNAGTLRYSSFAVSPAANAQEFVFTNTALNAAMRPLGVTFTNASTQYSRREPGLVQVPTSLETLLVYVDASGTLRQSSLQTGNGQFWEPASLAFTNSGASISSARSVSLVAVGQEVWMASPTASSIRLYRLSGANSPPASTRSWELMTTLLYTTEHRPTLVAVSDLSDPALTRLVVFHTWSGAYWIAQSSAGTSATAWTTGWSRSTFEDLADVAQPSAGSAVWDDRPIVTAAAPPGHPNWPDLRATIEHGRECDSNSQCADLHPAATCTGGFCYLDGDPYVLTDFAPFARGPAIGIYADYDEWEIIPFRTCEFLRVEPALPGAPQRFCGGIPRWDEPFGSAIITPPPLDDRIVNAHLYARPLPCQRCAQ